MVDGHGQKSSDVIKTTAHETFAMLPLEDASNANENDKRRTSQVYPGAVSRKLWVLMQSPSTENGMLISTNMYNVRFQMTVYLLTLNNSIFLVFIRDLIQSGHLRMSHYKLVISIGGRPNSLDETKLWKALRVSFIFNI